ncbi:NTP pyrophosphatase (non-canonical NTP hydrolase) [Leucobacter exalbidus]|uniref:NTP pyrophosphatase (Non-canonical NTP hydrolase) n=1 Tax=Leucobacter exalbidus TaxID=662960 RepID=A0A940PSB4_9MICO|nr:nucleotide pyrophosphohydrolase [Leucobacter exalbidus]MBP1325857.1 NTP pyrophosphatase (non-canonical NTP hydrolase) [Leucobacter exalbidus]
MISEQTIDVVRAFSEEREWGQFHTPENLAKSVAIEAGELLECFQWGEGDVAEAKDELADVLTYCILLAERLHLNLDDIILDKLARSAEKYPVALARGRSDKYDKL